jgi:hypothetical protein
MVGNLFSQGIIQDICSKITETVEIKDGVMTLEKFQQELAEYMKGIYGG